MTWQSKVLRKLIKTTCDADRRNTVWSVSVNARLNRVHDIAASYAVMHVSRRIQRTHDKGGEL